MKAAREGPAVRRGEQVCGIGRLLEEGGPDRLECGLGPDHGEEPEFLRVRVAGEGVGRGRESAGADRVELRGSGAASAASMRFLLVVCVISVKCGDDCPARNPKKPRSVRPTAAGDGVHGRGSRRRDREGRSFRHAPRFVVSLSLRTGLLREGGSPGPLARRYRSLLRQAYQLRCISRATTTGGRWTRCSRRSSSCSLQGAPRRTALRSRVACCSLLVLLLLFSLCTVTGRRVGRRRRGVRTDSELPRDRLAVVEDDECVADWLRQALPGR